MNDSTNKRAARAWKAAAKRWRRIRNDERRPQIDDYLRARSKIMRLLRVAYAAVQLSDDIGEFGEPVNGTQALDDAILAIYGDTWLETKARLRAELRAMESPRKEGMG